MTYNGDFPDSSVRTYYLQYNILNTTDSTVLYVITYYRPLETSEEEKENVDSGNYVQQTTNTTKNKHISLVSHSILASRHSDTIDCS